VWTWTCTPCAMSSAPLVSPDEAVQLAGVHDELMHGSTRTADVDEATPQVSA
jgi:hypothetical protein